MTYKEWLHVQLSLYASLQECNQAFTTSNLRANRPIYLIFTCETHIFGAVAGISCQCHENVMDRLTLTQNNKCALSSLCSDEKLMALVVVFLTELLSAQVAINPASSSQSNFQHLLQSRSCMADLAGLLLWSGEWCICSAPPFSFWQFFRVSIILLAVSITIRLTSLWGGWAKAWDGIHHSWVLT